MKSKYLTTAEGIPVADNNSLTAGKYGTALVQDVHLLEKHGVLKVTKMFLHLQKLNS